MRLRAQRGFTLIEMMVVVAIIAILGGLLISASGRSVGANARNISQQLVSTLGFARLRAAATRRIHRVTIEPQRVTVQVNSMTGLALQGGSTWEPIRTTQLPNRVKIWDAQNAVVTTTGATVTEEPTLAYTVDVRPDGQATPTTVYVTDSKESFRVLVYRVTGASYARPGW